MDPVRLLGLVVIAAVLILAILDWWRESSRSFEAHVESALAVTDDSRKGVTR